MLIEIDDDYGRFYNNNNPSLLTTLPHIYTCFHPFSTLRFTALPFTSLHYTFFKLLDDFTSLPFTTLLNNFPHSLFFFNSPK